LQKSRENARKCPEVRAGALNLPVSRNGSKVVPRPKGGFPKGKIREKIFPKKIFPWPKKNFSGKKNVCPDFLGWDFFGSGIFSTGQSRRGMRNPQTRSGVYPVRVSASERSSEVILGEYGETLPHRTPGPFGVCTGRRSFRARP